MDYSFAFREKPLTEYSRGELSFLILAILAGIVLISGVVVVAPAIGALFKLLEPKNKQQRLKIKRALLSLEKKGFIESKTAGGYKATKSGTSILEYDLLAIQKNKWDKKWRLVMFDIPESKRSARIALSNKVLSMGMRHMQDSVFISPYPCEKEILKVAQFLRVQSHVLTVVASSVSNERHFIKEFDL